jgi:hypothetical protein
LAILEKRQKHLKQKESYFSRKIEKEGKMEKKNTCLRHVCPFICLTFFFWFSLGELSETKKQN